MKTHRPWQPHLSTSPLFNPFTPSSHSTMLDHYDLVEEDEQAEEEQETGKPDALSLDEASDPPPGMKRD
jgi:hypothetical protein